MGHANCTDSKRAGFGWGMDKPSKYPLKALLPGQLGRSVFLKTKHTTVWAKLQPFLPLNVFSVNKLRYKPSILSSKKEQDWQKHFWWRMMQKLQKRCVFFLPWKWPSVPLTKTCKSVQVYSKYTVKQQEMWKEYPVLKERTQLGLCSLKCHPCLLFPACFLNSSISPCL